MPLILLTGPKHAGKSSAGRALAALYQCEFLDLDELVSQQSGKSPRTLYQEGVEVFRRAEAAALAGLLAAPAGLPAAPGGALRVVAAGGGLIDNAAALGCLTPVSPLVSDTFDDEAVRGCLTPVPSSVSDTFGDEVARRCLTPAPPSVSDTSLPHPFPQVVMVYLDVSAKTAWQRIRAEKTLPPFLNTATPEETHRALHERRAAAYRQRAWITIAAEGKSPSAVAETIADEIAVRSRAAKQTV
jgi:shikimate kinase